MGRPIKTTKVFALLPITNTTTTTNVVTTSANLTNLGILAGMHFVLDTGIGGLVAGTTYYVLKIVSANTFTVSATSLSANTTNTAVSLTTATGSATASVRQTDTGFNNPAGSANTYSVVGGTTAAYGKQISATVAIGQTGTGNIFATTTSANIYGGGTNFANTLVANTAVQSTSVGGTRVNIGFVSSVSSANIAVTNTTANTNIITTSGNAQTLTSGQPVTFSANLGGLVANKVYFVGTIANTTSFTVTTTQNGAPAILTTATGTTNALQDKAVLTANATANVANGPLIFSNVESGYIVRQKGKQKYLVAGLTSGLQSHCYTANVANSAMTPNTMVLTATYANSATVAVQSISDHTAELFSSTSGTSATLNGNVSVANSTPVFVTMNTAATANANAGIQFPVVVISNS